jgi:hypothetical protein
MTNPASTATESRVISVDPGIEDINVDLTAISVVVVRISEGIGVGARPHRVAITDAPETPRGVSLSHIVSFAEFLEPDTMLVRT